MANGARGPFGVRDFSTALAFSPFPLRGAEKGEGPKAAVNRRTPKSPSPGPQANPDKWRRTMRTWRYVAVVAVLAAGLALLSPSGAREKDGEQKQAAKDLPADLARVPVK